MERNGWSLFQHPLFQEQFEELTVAVEKLVASDPKGYQAHPKTKLLNTIKRFVLEIIPANPNAPEFRQGNTLGVDNRHWFRAKFHERFRLFYRFSSKDKVIIYVWVNDETSLRKRGAATDVYAVFKGMLESGSPPNTFDELKQQSHALSEGKESRPAGSGHVKSQYRKKK